MITSVTVTMVKLTDDGGGRSTVLRRIDRYRGVKRRRRRVLLGGADTLVWVG